MAKEGYPLDEEYELGHYRNPVTGSTEVIVRKRHNLTRSPRLEFFRQCVAQRMEGRRFRTGNPAEDEREVREAFAEAAHQCAKADKAYPSDRS
jgi:hypothetical protein